MPRERTLGTVITAGLLSAEYRVPGALDCVLGTPYSRAAASRPLSREEAPLGLLVGHLLHAQAQGRQAVRDPPVLRQPPHLVEGPEHQLAELVVDVRLAPHELLDVLDPLEVRHRHPAGI